MLGKAIILQNLLLRASEQWWNLVGKYNYVDSKNLLICADGGGSNGKP